MAACFKHSSKVAKALPFPPLLPTASKSFFCSINSTGEKAARSEKEKAAAADDSNEKEGSKYGDVQRKPGDAAQSAHSEWEKSGSQPEHEEKLADTGFDMSKRTNPSGSE